MSEAGPDADRPPVGRLRRWLGGRTLRGQLIAGLVSLLALAYAAVGVVTYVVLSHTVLDELDPQLQAAGGRYASCMEQQHDGQPPGGGIQSANCNQTPGLSAGTFGARVKNGVVTDQGIIDGTSHLSAADEATLIRQPADGGFYTRDLGSIHGDYRLTAVPGQDGDVLITGFPLSCVLPRLRDLSLRETFPPAPPGRVSPSG